MSITVSNIVTITVQTRLPATGPTIYCVRPPHEKSIGSAWSQSHTHVFSSSPEENWFSRRYSLRLWNRWVTWSQVGYVYCMGRDERRPLFRSSWPHPVCLWRRAITIRYVYSNNSATGTMRFPAFCAKIAQFKQSILFFYKFSFTKHYRGIIFQHYVLAFYFYL